MRVTAEKPYADLKVLGCMADLAACGYYRLEFPYHYLRERGAQADTTTGITLELLTHYDMVVVQRNYTQRLLDIAREAQRMGVLVLYELDDYLHGVHPSSPAYRTFRPGGENLRMVDAWLKLCDGLIVSTPELAQEYSPYTRRCWTVPNGIDFQFRDWENPAPRLPEAEGRTVIGWAGSSFHQDDNQPLVGVLKRVLEANPYAVFAIASGPQQVRDFLKPLDLPLHQVLVLPPVSFHEYPQLLSRFDIALAPLTNTRFNRSKSELKLLENGAWGTPYIASHVAPYSRFHRETGGAGGYLAATPQEWETALNRLLNDPAERAEKGAFLKECVRDAYSIPRQIHRWADALRSARDLAHYQPQAEVKTAPARTPGRNDPCPCGSARKYKKCCSPCWGT